MNKILNYAEIARRARRLVLLGIGALAGLLLVEIFLWLILITPMWQVLPVVPPFVMKGVGRPDSMMASEHFAGNTFVWDAENRAKIHINSLGLRDRELSLDKPPGVTRIALMGDSFIEALQVEQVDTFDDRTEEILRGLGHDVEIVNLAISGQIPLEQLVRLEEVGERFDSDIVVTIARARDFTSGEMRSDIKWPGYVVGPDGSLERGETFKLSFARRNSENWKGKVLTGALRFSNIARMLNYKRVEEPLEILGLSELPAGTVIDECATAELAELRLLWVEQSPVEDWAATVKYFDEYSAQIERVGAKSIYAMRAIPVPTASCSLERTLRSEIVEAAKTFIDARGIKFVDWEVELRATIVLKRLRTADTTALQGFGRNLGVGHYNFDGHAASAEVLVNSVRFALP